MALDWTTIVASAITAVVIGSTQFITIRYLSRILDRWEKAIEKQKEQKPEEKP